MTMLAITRDLAQPQYPRLLKPRWLPAPKATFPGTIVGMITPGGIYIAGDDTTYHTLAKQMPTSETVIRIKARQMEHVPIKSHFYNDTVIFLPPAVGSTIDVDGFARGCHVVEVYQKWGMVWMRVEKNIGKHALSKTIRLNKTVQT